MATAPLRNLAVTVVESPPGTFHLKLTEDLVVDVEAAMDDFSSWGAAIDAGVAALKRCADDLIGGPRGVAGDLNERH